MAIRISDKHDALVLASIGGMTMTGANKDTLLQNVKTYLDANYASFKDGTGNYTVPHVKAALTAVMNRGK